RRAGTAAARLPAHLPDEVKKERSARMLALSDVGARRFAGGFVGRSVQALWEGVTGASEAGFRNSGLTDHYLRVEVESPDVLTNTISTVRVTGVTERGVAGAVLSAESL